MLALQKAHKQLANQAARSGSAISLYQPTHPLSARAHLEEDRIRFKSALQTIEQHYQEQLDDLQGVMKQLHKLYDDRDFWYEQSQSLAIIADEQQFQIFKLPIETTECAVIEMQAILLPVVLVQSLQQHAYVLDLSLHGGRLFEASYEGVTRVQGVTVPGFDEVMEADNVPNLQFHAGNGAGGTPMYHGHGGSKDKKSEDVELYMQVIVKQLQTFFQDKNSLLILAGDEFRMRRIRELLKYDHIMEPMIVGNHEHENAAMLQSKTFDILLADRLESIAAACRQFDEVNGLSDKTAIGLGAIEHRAAEGAVDSMYIPCLRMTNDGVQPGYDGHLLLEIPSTIVALNRVAAMVAQQGGMVVPVFCDAFSDDQPRAILRY